MMSDDPLAEFRADWHRQHIDIVAVAENSLRWRRRTHLLIATDMFLGLVGLGAGVVFALLAWKIHDWLFGLSAFTLLFVCPAFAISLVRTRRLSVDWKDKTPEGTLQYALARTLAINKILKIELWNGIVLLCFVALVWLGVWAGLISRRYPLVFLSVIWIVTAIGALLWVKWRAPRNALERKQCEQLLAEFQATRAVESSQPKTQHES
jgi:hypothetical protein